MCRAFKWVPIQARELAAEDVYFRGVYVNSLSLELRGVSWRPLDGLTGSAACLMASKMVFCKGLVQCSGMKIAQLPEDMRPSGALSFAVLCDRDGDRSLSRLTVRRDGWLCIDSVAPGCIIDLSGVRFGIRGGLPIAESVQVFACDVNGQRLVILQGSISEKVFDQWPGSPLIQLPPDFRPPRSTFIVPGGRSGGFHLLQTCPAAVGGCLYWRDSVWNRDEMDISAVTYTTHTELYCLPSSLVNNWSESRRNIVVADFRKFLKTKLGTAESAWQSFDVYGDGQLDFSQFAEGCKLVKFKGNVCRLWSMLDLGHHGSISFDDMFEPAEEVKMIR